MTQNTAMTTINPSLRIKPSFLKIDFLSVKGRQFAGIYAGLNIYGQSIGQDSKSDQAPGSIYMTLINPFRLTFLILPH
jgi:hypothetical protein